MRKMEDLVSPFRAREWLEGREKSLRYGLGFLAGAQHMREARRIRNLMWDAYMEGRVHLVQKLNMHDGGARDYEYWAYRNSRWQTTPRSGSSIRTG